MYDQNYIHFDILHDNNNNNTNFTEITVIVLSTSAYCKIKQD